MWTIVADENDESITSGWPGSRREDRSETGA